MTMVVDCSLFSSDAESFNKEDGSDLAPILVLCVCWQLLPCMKAVASDNSAAHRDSLSAIVIYHGLRSGGEVEREVFRLLWGLLY